MASMMNRWTEQFVGRIERASFLDPVAESLAKVVARVSRPGPVKNTLSGTPIGHPLHPVLVLVPAGSWVAATYFDLLGGEGSRDAAIRLLALGNLAAVPAALTGANDWLDTAGAERRVGLIHAGANYAALGFFVASRRSRRHGHHGRGVSLSLAGTAVVSVAGWLGGHLAFARGVGVDTTAFQVAPADWVDVAAESDLAGSRPIGAHAGTVPILLSRRGADLVAIADRCSHRGGPLHEGTYDDGCVVCPWHGSRFRLNDGAVMQGPATRGQVTFEVRLVEGRVQVRRGKEPGTLRTRPTT